jgi:ADP-ribose pyrophosphatase
MKVTKVEQLTGEKWVNLFAATYENRGHTGRWVFASRRPRPPAGAARGDAVLIVPVLRNPGEPPRLVLIREFRVPVGDVVLAFPAGLLEEGEPLEETVRRELREETGLEVAAIKRVTQPLFTSSGMSDESVAIAFVDALGKLDPGHLPEQSESIEVLLADHAEVCRLCDDTGLRVDAKTWPILYLYRQLGKLE